MELVIEVTPVDIRVTAKPGEEAEFRFDEYSMRVVETDDIKWIDDVLEVLGYGEVRRWGGGKYDAAILATSQPGNREYVRYRLYTAAALMEQAARIKEGR